MRRPGLTTVRAAPNPGGYSPIWPPTRLPGCVAWYDMLETYTTPGATVTAIRNMVTGADDMAEATNPPALELVGLNGLPCMKGDGTNDQLISTEASAVSAFVGLAPAHTLFLVCEFVLPVATTRALVSAAASAGNGNHDYVTIAPGGPVGPRLREQRTGDNGQAGNVTTSTAVDFVSVPQVVSFASDGSGSAVYSNLAQVATSMSSIALKPTATPDRLGIFCRPAGTPSLFSAHRIGAVLLYRRNLPPSEVRGVISALMARWRIAA